MKKKIIGMAGIFVLAGLSGSACFWRGTAKPLRIEWVRIEGGRFMMGTENGNSDSKPVHEVAIKTFEMSKTEVTVEQYARCVSRGRCAKPGTGDYCNWGRTGREHHPVNCVGWKQANQYAEFKRARLPSESEWEYAAKSRGKNKKYPWGGEGASCERAVMHGNGGFGCGTGATMPVCSKPAGDTAQGLCDMAGNVWEWVQDKYQDSYANVPADGGAFEAAGPYRVRRGGSFYDDDARTLRADRRDRGAPRHPIVGFGFRLAR